MIKNLKKKIKEFFINYSKYFIKIQIKRNSKFNVNKIEKSLFKKSSIKIVGNSNFIEIKKNGYFNKFEIKIFGNNNKILIGENVRFENGAILWIEDDNCSIVIGENSTFNGFIHPAVTEKNSIINIGKNCMFSSNIELRTGDSHSIIDINTNERINFSQNIEIADQVWIGANTKILKGVRILENSIVGNGSIVTKKFNETNIIIAGVPAKIVKRNITWIRERI